MAGRGRASSTSHLQPQNDPTDEGDDRNFALLPAPPKAERAAFIWKGANGNWPQHVWTDANRRRLVRLAGLAGLRADVTQRVWPKLACQPGPVKSRSLTRARSWGGAVPLIVPLSDAWASVLTSIRDRLNGRTRPLTSESAHVDKPGQATKEMKGRIVFWESRAMQQPQRSYVVGVVSTDLLLRAQNDLLPN